MIDNYVTGGRGFIGSHLLKKLKGNTKSIPYTQIGLTEECKNFYHLSTYGNMADHVDAYKMVKANVVDMVRLVARPIEFIIFMSSSSVMLNIQTSYSRTKRAAEEILLALPQQKSCIIRPYSVTGVGEQKQHLIPTLIRSCLSGEEMDFDPSPVHDFVDVEDVVDALISVADTQVRGILEFGSGIPRSNEEVREMVETITGKKSNIKSERKFRDYDSSHWYCRIHNANFLPKKKLEQSIVEMVEAYVE